MHKVSVANAIFGASNLSQSHYAIHVYKGYVRVEHSPESLTLAISCKILHSYSFTDVMTYCGCFL